MMEPAASGSPKTGVSRKATAKAPRTGRRRRRRHAQRAGEVELVDDEAEALALVQAGANSEDDELDGLLLGQRGRTASTATRAHEALAPLLRG
jgi:hypothetical protein